MNKIILATVTFALLISGCGQKVLLPYDENYKCDKGENNGSCMPVSELIKKDTTINNRKDKNLNTNLKVNIDIDKKLKYEVPNRTPDRIVTAYIYPYVDQDGDLHSSKTIRIKIENGKWENHSYYKKEDSILGNIND
jgi:hypothetical protein